MTVIAVALCFVSQVCSVSGQLLFKRAMNPPSPRPISKTAWLMFLGIATQAAWFFLWLGLLEKWDLSKLYPFEGMAPAILAVAALIFLKERLSPMAWAGLGLICVGIGIVSNN